MPDSASQIRRDTSNELRKDLEKNQQEINDGVIGAAEDRATIIENYATILEQRLYQNEVKFQEKIRNLILAERDKTIAALKAKEQKNYARELLGLNDQLEATEEGQMKSYDRMERTLSLKRFKQFGIIAQQQKESIDAILNQSQVAEYNSAQLDYLEALSKATNPAERENIELDWADKKLEIERKYNKAREKNAKDTEDNIDDQREKKLTKYIELVQTSFNAIADVSNAILDAEIALSDRLLSEQQKRVDRAREIADRGNAELLQRENEKYNKLLETRQKYVNQQKALAMTELLINQTAIIIESIRTITKEGASKGVPGLIIATAALAAGIFAAKANAQSAMAGYETGGYTGDGKKKEAAGVVHKGEFVFTQEKTKKYRGLFEEIHKGRDPYLAMGVSDKIIVVNNNNMDGRLERIEKAILGQNRMQISIDEKGIHGIVSQMDFKNRRLNTRF